MAQKPTIFKAALDVSDLDRAYYGSHQLTLARHASETDERMMVRLLAFAVHADERLTFGAGLSDSDEADVWQKDLTGVIQLWIDVGQPDPRSLRKACGRAAKVQVIAYGRGVDPWWRKVADELAALRNLQVLALSADEGAALASVAARNMSLHVLIQDGVVTFSAETGSVSVAPRLLK